MSHPHNQTLTLVDLSISFGVRQRHIVALVEQGVAEPTGATPTQWRFDERAAVRLLRALRLRRDLHINAAGASLAIELLEEIDRLKREVARLQRRT